MLHGAPSGADAAPEQTRLFSRRFRVHHGHGHFVDDGVFRERGRPHEVIYGRTIARPSKSRLFVRLHDAPPGPLSGVRSNKQTNKHARERMNERMKEEHIKCEHHHERDIVSSSSFKERHIERKEKKTTTKKKTHKKQTRSSKIETIGFSLTSPLGTGLSLGARKTCTVARFRYSGSTLDSTE